MNRRRLELRSVNVSAGSGSSGVSVMLRSGDVEAVGAAAGMSASIGATTARATLRALDSFTEHNLRFQAISQASVGELEVMLVAVVSGRESLVGVASLGQRSIAEASARATLDAVNRLVTIKPGGAERSRHHEVYNIQVTDDGPLE